MDLVDKKSFEASVQELASVTQRNSEAANAEKSSKGLLLFCPLEMFDNWWHCRSYLAVLRHQIEEETGSTATIDDCETDLMMVLSMIRIAAEDPLPWVMVIDHVLRKLSREVPAPLRDQPFMKDTFNELTIFTHGVVVNAFVLRCEKASYAVNRIMVSVLA